MEGMCVRNILVALVLALAGIFASPAGPALADPVADFYKGKKIRIIIRAGPGGNFDRYSRLLGRHISKYLPGNPSALPINMPGGSGLVALNHVEFVAPHDGTVLTMITPTFPIQQALRINKRLKVDMRKLNWIGTMTDANTFLLVTESSPTKSIMDAKKRQTAIGVPSKSDTSAWLVYLLNSTINTKFRLVAGYSSGPEMNLALERGELEGRGTSNPQRMLRRKDIRYNLILQVGLEKNADFPKVPLLNDLAGNGDEKAVFGLFSKLSALARTMCTNSGVPAERVTALRRAFDATMKDPEFLAEAKKQTLMIHSMTGEKSEEIVASIVNAPAAVINKVRDAVTSGSAAAEQRRKKKK